MTQGESSPPSRHERPDIRRHAVRTHPIRIVGGLHYLTAFDDHAYVLRRADVGEWIPFDNGEIGKLPRLNDRRAASAVDQRSAFKNQNSLLGREPRWNEEQDGDQDTNQEFHGASVLEVSGQALAPRARTGMPAQLLME
jgi:hypothetical protein